jgi:hypothetical protein
MIYQKSKTWRGREPARRPNDPALLDEMSLRERNTARAVAYAAALEILG